MRLVGFGFLVALVTASGYFLLASPKPSAKKSNNGIVSGTIDLPEISGAAFLNGRLLVAADDPEDANDPVKKLHMVGLLSNASDKLKTEKVTLTEDEQLYPKILKALGESKEDFLADLEDVAVTEDGAVYLISSHSQSKSGKSPAKRKRLVRLHLNASGLADAQVANTDLLAALSPSLAESTQRRPGDDNPGFNIEGLAAAPGGDLLIGLRAPLQGSKAIVLRLAHPYTLFDAQPTKADLKEETQLDLHGHGIRGMCFDPQQKGYWIIGGLSTDVEPSPKNDWSLWFWDGKFTPKERLTRSTYPELSDLNAPEAISLTPDGQILLISDNDKATPSTYRLVPISKLK